MARTKKRGQSRQPVTAQVQSSNAPETRTPDARVVEPVSRNASDAPFQPADMATTGVVEPGPAADAVAPNRPQRGEPATAGSVATPPTDGHDDAPRVSDDAVDDETREWAVLIYLCGDNPLAHATLDDLEEIARVGASPQCYVAVQHDYCPVAGCAGPPASDAPPQIPTGTYRYVFREPGSSPAHASDHRTAYLGHVNTGDSKSAIDFLRWGFAACPARHVAVIIGGVGVTNDPHLCGVVARQRDRLFSVCDDFTARDALDAHELRDVLVRALDDSFDVVRVRRMLRRLVDQLSAANRESQSPYWHKIEAVLQSDADPRELRAIVQSMLGPPNSAVFDDFESLLLTTRRTHIDLLCMDMSSTQYLEIAYQVDDLVQVVAGSQDQMPPDAWPYQDVLGEWQRTLGDDARAGRETTARRMGELAVTAIDRAYGSTHPHVAYSISALDLTQIDEVTRAFDALAMALLQSIGDPLVFDVREALAQQVEQLRINEQSYDLVHLLGQMCHSFSGKAHDANIPAARRDRMKRLVPLVTRTIDALLATEQGPDSSPRFIIANQANRPTNNSSTGEKSSNDRLRMTSCGVSIYRPSDLSEIPESYLRLRFAQRVHWAALLGALRLIDKEPERLWDLISSVLGAGGLLRDGMVMRLTGPGTAAGDLQAQFSSIASPPMLTLSLEQLVSSGSEVLNALQSRIESIVAEVDSNDRALLVRRLTNACQDQTPARYRVRIESPQDGAVVAEQDVRVHTTAIDAALDQLNKLLATGVADSAEIRLAEALGRSLGEDIIQNLGEHLETRRSAGNGSAHLCLQLPRALMRYPWELMYDRRGPLAERFAIGRQIFSDVRTLRSEGRRRSPKLRVLIVGNPTIDERAYRRLGLEPPPSLAGAAEEATRVNDLFAQLNSQATGLPEIEVRPLIDTSVNGTQLRQWIRDGQLDILHFAGHGEFNRDDPETSSWLLSDGPLWAQEIRNTLAWCDCPPWLVFANACEAGMDAESKPGRYNRDVFGLASACIQQGVTAYLAPLWPIDDELALLLAVDFYRSLLLDGRTVGESLRRAKERAKRATDPVGEPPKPSSSLLLETESDTDRDSAFYRLSWASMVLYGQPNARLIDSMWSAESAAARSAPSESTPAPAVHVSRASRPIHVSRQKACDVVCGPGMVPAPAKRGDEPPDPNHAMLELHESNGVRHWRIVDQSGTRSLPESRLPELAKSPVLRRAMGRRGGWDYTRRIGRWLVGLDDGLLQSLATQYDLDKVKSEQLWRVQNGTVSENPLPSPDQRDEWKWIDSRDGRRRVLLIIHGTISEIGTPLHHLGESFLRRAEATYAGVIGFNHFTLSRTPEQNAQRLVELLPRELRVGKRLDVITHSRGGLVARAFVELLGHHPAVRRVVFGGTPNAGTNLARPANIGRAADLLVNFLIRDVSDSLGKLAGLLARLAVKRTTEELLNEIPGLWAQNPATASDPNTFLGRLQATPATDVDYYAIAANYEPDPDHADLSTVLRECSDAVVDSFYAQANDLVVDTSHVWAVGRRPDPNQAGTRLPAKQILVFDPTGETQVPDSRTVAKFGVDHFNLFAQNEARQFLHTHLFN